jgi:hypothetical protein
MNNAMRGGRRVEPRDHSVVATRPARAAPPSIARAVGAVFADLARRTRHAEPALIERWREIVGAELAGLCAPGRLSGGLKGATLEILARDGAAAARVQFESEAIRRAVNAFLGPAAVARILVRHRSTQTGPDGALSGALSRFRASMADRKPDKT